ncbi:nicotinate phosphoribosyltransferase [Pelomonas sp. P7]|uniref:Nicotinamide phosphoribosyltransferase n=1 Tax=Pelomonas caseinilytica TaxID=2906763 RepID=A0ABS8XGX9_9BURK|nr:nicotinate phosphoribosyltransferase [Pelomonas sp. P7]MCE4539003.1 nicotinate phosphoribosyltransferase [Pelomonas sp. P7]
MPLHRFSDIAGLLVLNTDSYKTSHWLQYPPGTQTVFSYIEARGGSLPYTVFFGLQALLKEYFTRPVAAEDVALAAEVCAGHGVPFNREGWLHIVRAHGGRLPLRIRAVPEGSVVPVNHALLTVENTDPACWWLTSYVETALLRVWYPTTVATHSHATRRLIADSLGRTGSLDGLPFKLHDFGARGVSSLESAMLGGMAHLVNFQGTDTMTALLGARLYYGEPMAGFSIPAAEHSTITAWGRDGELAAYRNMLRQFGQPGALLAVVSDSYDLDAAVTQLWGGALRDEVIASGATVVIRPDSGDPTSVVLRTVRALDASFGSDVNAKGFKVLRHVRVIQGDGITRASIASILGALESAGYSADNVAFGQGGALLQQVNRDTLGFAMKASAAQVDGQWRDVFKAPVTDPAKRSKAGRLTLLRRGEAFATVRLDVPGYQEARAEGAVEVMRTVYENGQLLVDDSFAAIRARAALG